MFSAWNVDRNFSGTGNCTVIKRCTKCGIEKPKSEFYFNRLTPDGLKYWCIECCKEYQDKRKHLEREQHLDRTYKLAPGQFEKISKSQDDKCLICREVKRLVPDHNHKTGRFRALLCHKCNLCVGLHENYPVEKYLNKPDWKFILVWLNSRNKRDTEFRTRYNICLDDWEMMFEVQNGVCGICFKVCATGNNLCVDHDWGTLRVRGLLCVSCNIKLGKDDNHDILGYIHHFSDNQITRGQILNPS